MTLNQTLTKYFEEYKRGTRQQLREAGNKYDPATVDRELRRMTEKGYIKPIQGSKRYNVEYILNQQEKRLESNFKSNKAITDDNYDKLEEVLRNIKPTWDNHLEIKIIKEASCITIFQTLFGSMKKCR